MAIEKITSTMKFEDLKVLATNADRADLVEFCDKQIEALAAKAEKAKERAAKKKAEGDELRAVIEEMIVSADEPITPDAIAAAIANEEVTKAKVVARVRQLVECGLVSKTEINVDGKKRVAYTAPVADAE